MNESKLKEGQKLLNELEKLSDIRDRLHMGRLYITVEGKEFPMHLIRSNNEGTVLRDQLAELVKKEWERVHTLFQEL